MREGEKTAYLCKNMNNVRVTLKETGCDVCTSLVFSFVFISHSLNIPFDDAILSLWRDFYQFVQKGRVILIFHSCSTSCLQRSLMNHDALTGNVLVLLLCSTIGAPDHVLQTYVTARKERVLVTKK
jgi:hypothetical protein